MSPLFCRENLLRWLLALGCFAVVIFFFSPSWAAFALWAHVPEMSGMLEVRRGASVLAQVTHPGAAIDDPLHQAIQWRLLFPVIGHVLGLPAAALFGLAHVGCIVVLAYVTGILRRRGMAWLPVTLGTIVIGAASWFFVSTGWLGYFDSWLALALLMVAFSERRWPVWAACVWAPWIDERFVIAVPVALFCRWLYAATRGSSAAKPSFNGKLDWGVPAALVVVFLLVRLGWLSGKSAGNATIAGYFAGKDYLDAPVGRILLGIWEGLRGGWVFVVAAVLALRNTPARAALLGVAVVLTAAVGLMTAQDYSRSMTMLLPVVMLGLAALGAATAKSQIRVLGATAAAALVLPAHHVMNDAVNPIYYLYHELAAFDAPPPTAMPELRELRAIVEMENGNFAGAERELTIAMKLSPNPAPAARRRGMLYASARQWERAKSDFTTVVENDPANPEGWFLRSEVEAALRDFTAARADFDHARAVAPAGWIDRPDVKRFMAMLNGAAATR